MYKRYIIAIITIIHCGISNSQELPYFNNVYNPENTYASGKSILQIDENYYGICGTEITSSWGIKLGLFKLSNSGNLLNWKIIGETNHHYYPGNIGGTLIKTNDDNLAFALQIEDANTVYGSLIKLNFDLDTLWKKDYYTENDLTMTVKVKQTSDNGYIMVGNSVQVYGDYYNAFILKADSNGDELWHNEYGGYLAEYGKDIIETPDGGYLIGGLIFDPPVDQSMDAMVIKTDSLGNEQWTKYYGNPNVDDDMALVAMADDGNFLVATVYGVNETSSDDRRGRTWFLKIDNNGQIIKDIKIGDVNRSQWIKNFRKTEDGYIASGFFVDSTYISYKGFLLKIDNNLDSMWMRKYSYFNELYDMNLFYDASPTTDNGYIAIGKARPDIGNNKMWVLKVDSMGCDTPGCATGTFIKELPLPAGNAGELRIWPNPAEGEFKVMPYAPPLVPPKGGKPSLLTVYNSQGIKVKEINIPATEKTTTVNVRDWQRGIYYVRMTRGGKNFGSGKVVVR